MNKKLIYNIKLTRLIISLLMVFSVFFYMATDKMQVDYSLPDQSLVMSAFISVFVFFIGIQYKIEKKQGMLANFLLLFSITMFMMTIVGFVT